MCCAWVGLRKENSKYRTKMWSQLSARCFLSIILSWGLLAACTDVEPEQLCGITREEYQYGNKLLVAGGTVVNADRQQKADVYIEDGIIQFVAPNLKVSDDVRVIDASGRYVMPGGIDPHTHMEMPFMGTETSDDFFTGQAAALAGGTTMHIDFIIPPEGDLAAGLKAWQEKAKKSCMDYGFHMAVTTWNAKVAKDMENLVLNSGINSFKFFLAYKGSLMVTDAEFLQGLKKCKELGALAQVHAENGDAVAEGQQLVFDQGITGPEGHGLSRPALVEGEATGRAIKLAQFLNTPLYVVHVMSRDALDEIGRARQSGARIVGEPVASGLALDDSGLWDPDFETAAKFVMSPPIRPAGHNKALQAALASGVLQVVGTDHCAFTSKQKAAGQHDFRRIPNGVNGIEERMHIVWDVMVFHGHNALASSKRSEIPSTFAKDRGGLATFLTAGNGLEIDLPVFYKLYSAIPVVQNSGKISVTDFVRVTSTASAQIFNIYPRKGAILPGSDADLIIFNPNKTTRISAKTHHSTIDTNIYEGWTLQGNVEVTISQGNVVWEKEQLNVKRGVGKYIPLPPFGPLFDGLDKVDNNLLASRKAPVQRATT